MFVAASFFLLGLGEGSFNATGALYAGARSTSSILGQRQIRLSYSHMWDKNLDWTTWVVKGRAIANGTDGRLLFRIKAGDLQVMLDQALEGGGTGMRLLQEEAFPGTTTLIIENVNKYIGKTVTDGGPSLKGIFPKAPPEP